MARALERAAGPGVNIARWSRAERSSAELRDAPGPGVVVQLCAGDGLLGACLAESLPEGAAP